MSRFYYWQALFPVAPSVYYSVVAAGTGWNKVYFPTQTNKSQATNYTYTKFVESTVTLNQTPCNKQIW
jgi:hypothetical protein